MLACFLLRRKDGASARLRPSGLLRLIFLIADALLTSSLVGAESHPDFTLPNGLPYAGRPARRGPAEPLDKGFHRPDVPHSLRTPWEEPGPPDDGDDGAIMAPDASEEEMGFHDVWSNDGWLLDASRGPPQRMSVRLPSRGYAKQSRWPRHRLASRQQPGHEAFAPIAESGGLLGRKHATQLGKPLFRSNTRLSGRTIFSATRDADLTLFGEERIVHRGIFDITETCGGMHLSPRIPGYALKKVCLWRHWADRFHIAHPKLNETVKKETASMHKVLKLTLALPSVIYNFGKALIASNSSLSSLAWLIVRETTNEIRKQQKGGEEVNVGRAMNNVLREHKELLGPLKTAFFLVSGLGCKADVPYTDRAREGYTAFAPDLNACPQNPLLQHLADHPEESLAWVPPGLPSRFSVTVAAQLPHEQQHERWRLPLYRLWHLLWFQIFEGYRLDHLWDWMKDLDTTQLVPGWEVKAVGSASFTEHRPAAYADGSWRFEHIDRETLELARNSDGRDHRPEASTSGDAGTQHSILSPSVKKFLVLHKKFGLILNPRAFSRRQTPSSLKSAAESNEHSLGETDGDNSSEGRSATNKILDDREESGEDDQCDDIQVLRDETSVTYIRCGAVLKIHKSVCGSVPTFDYVTQSPYAVLLVPLSETVERANAAHTMGGMGEPLEPHFEALRRSGWTLADAVWAFRPTTNPKMWAVNSLVTPLQTEPLLSKVPSARMHRGYRAFFHLALKGLVDGFIAALVGHEGSSSAGLPSEDRSWSSRYKNVEGLSRRFHLRTAAEPFTVVFSGLSVGGAMAGIAAIYFVRQMRKKRVSKHLRVMCVAFGAPSWGSPQMYAAFDELGIIWNEIWTSHDPIPELLAGEDITGLAYDRRQIVLHGSDWNDVHLTTPFAFDGRAWVEGAEQTRLWQQILFWIFNLHKLSTLPLHPKIAHQHGYSAALSLISGAYKYSGWMSHLAVPWIPLPQMEVTTFPESMEVLAAAHSQRLEAEKQEDHLGLAGEEVEEKPF
ncbi:hypothetical protein Efla_001941 [Eimeria flavescens]